MAHTRALRCTRICPFPQECTGQGGRRYGAVHLRGRLRDHLSPTQAQREGVEKKQHVILLPGALPWRLHSCPTLSDFLLCLHPRPCRMLSRPGFPCHLERLGRCGDVSPNHTAPLTQTYTPRKLLEAGLRPSRVWGPLTSPEMPRIGRLGPASQRLEQSTRLELQTSKLDHLPVPRARSVSSGVRAALPLRAPGEGPSCLVQLLVGTPGWWPRHHNLCPRGLLPACVSTLPSSGEDTTLLQHDLPLTITPAESLLPRKLTFTGNPFGGPQFNVR